MAQYALPAADIAKTGWSQLVGDNDADAWDELDEGFGAGRGSGSGPDDGTTVWQTAASADTSLTIECGLSGVTDPNVHTGHTIKARIAKSAAGGAPTAFTLSLVQGTTVIGSSSGLLYDSTAYTDLTYTLSEAEAAGISNYADLRARLVVAFGAGNARRGRVSAFELETPDVSSGEDPEVSRTMPERLTFRRRGQ